MMRKMIVLVAALALLILPMASAYAGGHDVEYTWTLAALGQGGWIGGPLFADGSGGGGGAYSDENGQELARFSNVTWTEDSAENITICFDVTIRKGPAELPPHLCLPPSPVTGKPVKVILFGEEHIFRISEVGHEG